MNQDKFKNKGLEKAILRVIAFFDMFDYPLTAFEIWGYVGVECKLEEICDVLTKNGPTVFEAVGPLPQIAKKNNFYFLKGREKIIETRLKRYNYTDEKFKRALWVSGVFKLIPWIKGIAIGNVIGAHNLKKDGDIDFFIITQKNRIWITRFYCILITKILGLRPKPGKIKNKICLSFFVSEDNLNLQDLMLKEKETKFPIGNLVSKEPDIYFIHWLAGLVPIYDSKNIFNNFFQENNWLKEYLPNWQPSQVHFKREIKEKSFCKIFKSFGSMSNKISKFLQLKMMNKGLKKMMNKDSRVVVNDKILKLHVNDRREKYRNKFLNYNV